MHFATEVVPHCNLALIKKTQLLLAYTQHSESGVRRLLFLVTAQVTIYRHPKPHYCKLNNSTDNSIFID